MIRKRSKFGKKANGKEQSQLKQGRPACKSAEKWCVLSCSLCKEMGNPQNRYTSQPQNEIPLLLFLADQERSDDGICLRNDAEKMHRKWFGRLFWVETGLLKLEFTGFQIPKAVPRLRD
ncbi:MAG: hypothetical protein IT258_05705 [Saprospiraceae bacterium]|nr:hypothetical protein [Saprospiraceae bacterium]